MLERISDRIQKRMKELGLKQADLVRATGAGRTTVFNWVNGNTEPTGEFPAKLAKVLKVDTTWLLIGETEGQLRSDMLADEDQALLIRLKQFLNLDPSKPLDLENFEFDTDEDSETDTISVKSFRKIKTLPKEKTLLAPVLNYVQAGAFNEYTDDAIADEFEPYDAEYGEGCYWVVIHGKSMEPDFYEGDKVLFKNDIYPNPGDYVIAVAEDKHETTFKKYRPKGFDNNGREYAELVPSNPDFPIIDSRYTPFEIRGVALERKQKLK